MKARPLSRQPWASSYLPIGAVPRTAAPASHQPCPNLPYLSF